jgi:DNA polymerase I-like protein with 3'-5' exonuclease and polymerase domains
MVLLGKKNLMMAKKITNKTAIKFIFSLFKRLRRIQFYIKNIKSKAFQVAFAFAMLGKKGYSK